MCLWCAQVLVHEQSQQVEVGVERPGHIAQAPLEAGAVAGAQDTSVVTVSGKGVRPKGVQVGLEADVVLTWRPSHLPPADAKLIVLDPGASPVCLADCSREHQ